MKKSLFTKLVYSYFILVIIAFAIYGFNVADANWEVNVQEEKPTLILFTVLFGIALVLLSIDGAGVRDKGTKIKRSTIYAGLSIAVFFLIWRLLMGIF
ncbi:hypothetical protein [Bacillus sp. Marseille-P3661]|uniref:hypothetical protein n=1 Tax=Bacillus sp. Marseille-P3661 TaxID=1936234 RepID=UPI000C818100|nr:hypothetical protein [Bacillus sp. Marseille-P3661]